MERFGGIDLLYLNAGINLPSEDNLDVSIKLGNFNYYHNSIFMFTTVTFTAMGIDTTIHILVLYI